MALQPLKINSIVKKKQNCKVYNLSVKEDETYIAEGIVVHNCRSVLTEIFRDEEYVADEDIGVHDMEGF